MKAEHKKIMENLIIPELTEFRYNNYSTRKLLDHVANIIAHVEDKNSLDLKHILEPLEDLITQY